MSDTTFVNGTVVLPAWLNDVNDRVYNGQSFDTISALNVKDPTFGAIGDGVADDTTAIQAAITAASTLGKIIFLPPGTYKVSAALTITSNNVSIYGSGNSSIISCSSTTADVFTIGNNVSEISGLNFRDFTIWSSVVKSAGYAFNNRIVTDSNWHNVNCGTNDLYTTAGGHRLFRGWYFDRFDTVLVFAGQCVTADDGVRCRGNADNSYGAELVLDGNLRFIHQNASGACGVRIGGTSGGVYLRRMDVSQAETGLIIDTTLQTGGTTATRRNREIFIEGANFDSCKKWGIRQVLESVALLVMNKPWAASCGTDDDGSGGIIIEGGATVSPFVVCAGAPFLYNNVGPGLRLEGGFISFDGGQILLNGRSASGGHGVEFGATLPIRFSITGTDIDDNGIAAKGLGINIPAGLDNFNIDGVSLFSNPQGQIINAAGFGPTKLIRNCLGYVTENSGVATVANGNSTVVINHGLSATPATVHLTPIGTPSVGTYNAGTFTSTQFTINNDAVAAGARQFSWRASVTGN